MCHSQMTILANIQIASTRDSRCSLATMWNNMPFSVSVDGAGYRNPENDTQVSFFVARGRGKCPVTTEDRSDYHFKLDYQLFWALVISSSAADDETPFCRDTHTHTSSTCMANNFSFWNRLWTKQQRKLFAPAWCMQRRDTQQNKNNFILDVCFCCARLDSIQIASTWPAIGAVSTNCENKYMYSDPVWVLASVVVALWEK